MNYFEELGLAQPILKALAANGYDTPTPIQQQAIPQLMEGRDLCGVAQTGTGKTAAFSLPSLHKFASDVKPRKDGSCRMLVLSPTRELAAQIAESIRGYGKFLGLTVQCIFGGVPVFTQKKKLRGGVDILVATPGRLLDLIDQRALSLDGVEIFVLDEADQMMDLGFIHDLKRVDKLLPKKRQTLFFSATMPRKIAELGNRFLTDPVRVSVAPQATTAERVEQYITFVSQREKQALLNYHLKNEDIERALVFTRTKHGADRVVRHLAGAGIEARAIHGNKSQGQRTAAMQDFRAGKVRVLVATDIAARGIDVPGVSHVFNFELPNVPEQYVHRIGRTARAGAEGLAYSFVADDERAYLKDIERVTKTRAMPMGLPEGFREMVAAMPAPVRRPKNDQQQRRGGGPRGRSGGGRGRNQGGGGRGASGGQGRGRNDEQRFEKRKENAGGGQSQRQREDGGNRKPREKLERREGRPQGDRGGNRGNANSGGRSDSRGDGQQPRNYGPKKGGRGGQGGRGGNLGRGAKRAG